MDAHTFEQGPIRPPSEATSLLVRVTRNCPWGKCLFCHNYIGTSFSLRTVEEIKSNIRAAKRVSEDIEALASNGGSEGRPGAGVFGKFLVSPTRYTPLHYHVARWLRSGGKTAFLQDANSLAANTADLVEILCFLKETFPTVERITTYARSKTLTKKSREDLTSLRKAGLSRVHVGLESGSNEVLTFMRKGVTAREHIEAGRKVKAAGISLSEYVVLGLGGKRWWVQHALETAAVLNQIDPDFIRLRTLAVTEDMPLHGKLETGEFLMPSEEQLIREERMLVEDLDGISSTFLSDHVLNLLQEVEGKLPEEKAKMLATLDQYLHLPLRDKLNFNLGRRISLYQRLEDLKDDLRYRQVSAAIQRVNPKALEGAFTALRQRFI
jgi:hypothetical protein